MLTDTQWLLSALVAEIQAAGIADTVKTFNGVDIEEAIRQLHAYPYTAVIVMPDLLTMDHDIQGGVPVIEDTCLSLLRDAPWISCSKLEEIVA